MRIALTALIGACFLVFATSAYAEIRIELPRAVSAEEFVKVFTEEAQQVPGIEVETEVAMHYEPGSVKEIPDYYMVNINRIGWFLFLDVPVPPFLTIKLNAGEDYNEILVYDRCHVHAPRHCPEDSSSTTDGHFKKMQPQFRELLQRVYARLGVEQ